jgi:hypothetical protein
LKLKFSLFLALILMICALGTAVAQDASGKITGTVHDPQGAVIPDAKIVVTNVGTGITNHTATDADGVYQVLHLPIGSYRVTAEQTGFQKVVTSPSQLQINATLKIDLTLPVGTANESVEVSGSAALVETQNATMGNSVTSRPIVDLPLNGRNVLDLAQLEPGVVQENPDNAAAGHFSIAGSRTDSVTFLLDGGVNNNLLDNGVVFNPSPDTIAEFKILESNYNAEYGRNAGGIISVVTKSGTNQLHGTAYDFARNDAFNANSFFNKANGIQRDVLKRHQFGGTLGGPIQKDKFFFFASYEGQRQTEAAIPSYATYSTFTPAMLTGDFSQSADKQLVADFLASNPYYQADPLKAAQGILDPTKIDPVAQNYVKAGIIPSSETGVIYPHAPQKTNYDEFTGKLDYNFSATDRLTTTLGFTRAPGNRPFAGGASVPFTVNDLSKTYYLNLAYNKTITANLLNELRITAQRLNDSQGTPAYKLPSGPDLGIAITPDLLLGPPILYFDMSGLTLGFSYRGPVIKVNNTFGVNDNLTWVKGKHTLKMGFGYSPYQNNTLYAYQVSGEFDYYGSTTGSEFADFLIGAPDEFIQSANAPSNVRSKNYMGFVQDEWRAKPNLTLSFGLRYEYSTPKHDTKDRTFSFVPGIQSTVFPGAPLGLLFPGDKGAPNGSNFPDRNDFAPRFGFAWDPKGDGKTSIRGGIGVFFDILKAEDNLQFNGQAPFNGYADIPFDAWTSVGPSPYMQDPFGSTGSVNTFPSRPPDHNIDFDAGYLPFAGNSVYFVDPNIRTPYVYQYNLSIQRELGHNLRADLAYVGSTAHKLTSLTDNNPFILGTTTRVQNTQPGVPSYAFNYMDTFKNVGYQNYNSLQASLKKQMSGETSKLGASYFTLAYTYAKNIDTASGFREVSTRVKAYNPGADRAVSDMDVKHAVVFSAGWDLPFHQLLGGPQKLMKGWTINPIVSLRTGFPIDIRGFLKRDRRIPGPSGAGDSGLVRPNLVGNSVDTYDPHANVTGSGALYFNPDNFDVSAMSYGFCAPGTTAGDCEDIFNARNVLPYSATYGTLPRNFFRGPGRANVDVSIAKVTQITERMKLEFRTEFFNLLNQAQFLNPSNTNPYSSGFGRITKTYDPRIMQLGAKIVF